jgi:hypothetical protein
MRPAGLHHRVARLEAEATRQTTPTIGATIAAILDGKHAGPRLSDEELGHTRMGRLLLQRRAQAKAGHPG